MPEASRIPPRRVARWLIPSYGTILALSALANALVARGASLFAWDGDGARHIRVGHEILRRGAVPAVDLFSHTRTGAPLVLHEWLSEVALATADAVAGLPGVAILAAVLFTAAVYGTYRIALELGAPRPLALGVGVLALFLQSIHLLARPHLFTTAVATAFMLVLLRYARTNSSRVLAALPALMLVWVNLHGGFLLGFVLIGAFTVAALLESREFVAGRKAARGLLVALLACAVVSLLNPAGPRVWSYTIGHLGGDTFLIDITREFRSVDFHQGYGKLFFVALFAGPVLWMTGRVRASWLSAGLYFFFALASLNSARNIPLFTVTSLPWLAVWGDRTLEGGGPLAHRLLDRVRRMDHADASLRSWGWCIVGIGLLVCALGPLRTLYRYDPGVFPVAAVSHLDDLDTSGPVFNEMPWGGYLLYARPELRVFIDGQTDFYGEELVRGYLCALHGCPDWREVLDEYDVAWTLTRSGEPLNQLLAADPGWRRVYEDPVATIYRRK